MANWAIVIGIDQYWRPEACLKGAVRDALQIYKWLTDVNGGAVPTRNITLLLSPSPTSPSAPPGVQVLPVTQDKIIEVIERLIQRSGGQGSRFFFYYAGHGLTSRINFSNENGLIPTDFSDVLTTKAITLRSIFELFQATQFQEQFFFIDACRNIPWEKEFRMSEYPLPRQPNIPTLPQFIMYATSPGVKAVEIGQAGHEGGAFTEALLNGLQGKGNAKVWDNEAEEYIVHWESLFKFVEAEVKKKQLPIDPNRVPPLIQEPRQFGERGSHNPELGRFTTDAFPKEHLDVMLDPASVAQAEIIVGDLGGIVQQASTIEKLPVQFTLEPRTYSVRVGVPSYQSERKFYPVDLYSPQTVLVKLIRQSSITLNRAIEHYEAIDDAYIIRGFGESPKLVRLNVRSPIIKGFGEFSKLVRLNVRLPITRGFGKSPKLVRLNVRSPITRGFSESPQASRLNVSSSDPLAQLELTDNKGMLIVGGQGNLEQQDLLPGFYRVRLRTPEGNYVERLIELLPSESEIIALDAPDLPDKGLFQDLIKVANIPIRTDNTIEPSEAVGPIASAQTSTLLALAGGAVNEESNYGYKLRGIGIQSFRQIVGFEANNGLQILFGIEFEQQQQTRRYLSQIRLRCWRQGEPEPAIYEQPIHVSSIDGLAEFAWGKPPGSYWLAIELPDQPPVNFAIAILPNRLTLMVYSQDVTGQANIYQYLPSLIPEPGDPRFSAARFPVLRRLELIQRSYISSNFEQAYQNARELLQAKWVDPMAGCLGGYLLLKLGRVGELEVAVRNLTSSFGQLSDSHILAAEYMTSQGRSAEAVEAFRKALDCGLPIIGDGLKRLVDGIQQYQIEHPNTATVHNVFNNRVRGSLWSAYIAEKISMKQRNNNLDSVDPIKLRGAILNAYGDEAKFKILCLDLRIPYAKVKSETLELAIANLIYEMQLLGRYSELVNKVITDYPGVREQLLN
jgi:Caspase domain